MARFRCTPENFYPNSHKYKMRHDDILQLIPPRCTGVIISLDILSLLNQFDMLVDRESAGCSDVVSSEVLTMSIMGMVNHYLWALNKVKHPYKRLIIYSSSRAHIRNDFLFKRLEKVFRFMDGVYFINPFSHDKGKIPKIHWYLLKRLCVGKPKLFNLLISNRLSTHACLEHLDCGAIRIFKPNTYYTLQSRQEYIYSFLLRGFEELEELTNEHWSTIVLACKGITNISVVLGLDNSLKQLYYPDKRLTISPRLKQDRIKLIIEWLKFVKGKKIINIEDYVNIDRKFASLFHNDDLYKLFTSIRPIYDTTCSTIADTIIDDNESKLQDIGGLQKGVNVLNEKLMLDVNIDQIVRYCNDYRSNDKS